MTAKIAAVKSKILINPDYALEMHKRLTSCKSICMAKLITTAKSG
jgi:hypothetical protein